MINPDQSREESIVLAKTNFQYEKRQKDLEKKRKKEEKLKKKADKANQPDGTTSEPGEDDEAGDGVEAAETGSVESVSGEVRPGTPPV